MQRLNDFLVFTPTGFVDVQNITRRTPEAKPKLNVTQAGLLFIENG
jgi:hypothetical protein